MNKDRWKKLMYDLVAVLLLSACSQDEPGENSTTLPEGEYPLQIGSVTLTAEVSEQPWTRVSESTDGMNSEFQPGDAIGVSLNGETATYTYDGTAWTSEAPLYWKDKNYATVTAWYPVDETIDFTHQDKGLAYLLKADGVEAGFDKPANLTFSHQLAKVRVKLTGDKAGEVQAVTVRSYEGTNNEQGTPNGRIGTAVYVPMLKATYDGETCWEANLLEGYLVSDNTFRVSGDGKNFEQAKLTGNVDIDPGHVHTITINVEQAPEEIDLDTYEGTTLTVSGKTIIKGGGGTQPKDLQITVEADAEVTLENVVLQPSALGNAITCNGDASITLVGNNNLTAKSNGYIETYGSGIYVKSGTLTIDGEGSLIISREYASDYSGVGAGIGAGTGANILIESGNIQIGDVPDDEPSSGAGIGSTAQENCGNITIKGGIIRIGKPSWWSACIGSANNRSCGDITISGESTVITFTKGLHAPWGIGNGEGGTCGTVTIGGGATVNNVKYTETHTGTL